MILAPAASPNLPRQFLLVADSARTGVKSRSTMSDVRVCRAFFMIRNGRRSSALISLALAVSSLPMQPAQAAQSSAALRASLMDLKAQDLRLAAMVYRLAVANAKLCRSLMPATGLVLHGRDQYSAEVRAEAGDSLLFETAVAVEGIVEESPAYAAGLAEGDSLAAIAGMPLPRAAEKSDRSSAQRDYAEGLLTSLPSSLPFQVTVLRSGSMRTFEIAPRPACRVRAEVLAGNSLPGQTDGDIAQFGDRVLRRLDENGLASVVAHELAHVVLDHRRKLEMQRVHKGLLAEFGNSRVSNRKAEIEADRMSVHLLANAGIDPVVLLEFWRGPGRSIAPDLFRSRAYPSRKERMALIEKEILAKADGNVLPAPSR